MPISPLLSKIALWSLGILAALLVALSALVYLLNFHPAQQQTEPVTNGPDAPLLPAGAPVKVLSWNVQYMAGKDYVFFYDLLDGSGPDTRPSAQAITRTLSEVARVIREQNPDVVLLQEIDDGSARTDGADQLALLLQTLPPAYCCHTSAFYWKSAFVPHPKILGKVGMKLSVISKYRIGSALRHQLPRMPGDPVTKAFNFKRAVLEVSLPRADGSQLVVMTTHLDAFSQGTDTMQQQVAALADLLKSRTEGKVPWILTGDFNLLASPTAYQRLPEGERAYFNPQTELSLLLATYPSIPSLSDIEGPDFSRWHTHFPNGSRATAPDRTIDYVFYSDLLKATDPQVLQDGTWSISDHLPIVAVFGER